MPYTARQNPQRGNREFRTQPSRDELEALDSFSFYDVTEGPSPIRVTFRKRRHGDENGRDKRRPTWNGYATVGGQTVAAYAGNSETFDLSKVLKKIRDAAQTS